VALIGQGMTNGEISTQLVLSKRTVEKHVANILSKLELTSRAQVVRWAMEHHLAGIPLLDVQIIWLVILSTSKHLASIKRHSAALHQRTPALAGGAGVRCGVYAQVTNGWTKVVTSIWRSRFRRAVLIHVLPIRADTCMHG
jgi:hypothetical protein